MKYPPIVVAFLALLVAVCVPRSFGQVNLGAIKGETQDAQRAAVPGVKLTLKNEATGVVIVSKSSPEGQFNFLNLTPGVYSLTAESTGFSASVQQHIVVSVGSTVSLLVPLTVGQVQQSVVVSADAGGVETQTSDVGTAITPEEIKDLPLSLSGDMRNPLNFVLLTPGVYGSTPGPTPDYRLHISGSVSYGDEVYVDGVPIMDTDLPGEIGPNHPPVDSISQFKLVNNNETAQYGLASGIISFAFKSGTNDWHGSLFDYLQNDALNASGYVTDAEYANCVSLPNASPQACAQQYKKAPLKQNEYGGTFGGPVLLPKLYNGRNRTFFFVNWTGFKFRPSSNNATLTTFPTPYRSGDFSSALGPQLTVNGVAVVDPAGKPVYQGAIYNPFSVHNVVGPDGQTYPVRDAFQGNVVPSGFANLSTVAQNVLKSFPVATNSAINDNFYRQQSSKIDEHRLVVKIDEHISDKHSISGSVFRGPYSNFNNGGLNDLDSNGNGAETTQIRLAHNYFHSPTLVNSVNVGFIRDAGYSGPIQSGPGLAALGIKGLPEFRSDSPYPQIGIGTQQNSIGTGGGSFYAENRYIVNDSLTLIRGSHSFTMGGELRWLQRNEGGTPGGSFTFEPVESALNGTGFANGQPVTIPVGTGNAAASFLFGGVDFVNIGYPIESAYRWQQVGMFFQDDWRILAKLTLNLGLRYDIQVPRSDARGNVSTMNPTLPNPAAGGLPGAFEYYGSGQGRNGSNRIGRIDYRGIQPRIGFAYEVDPRTSVRGGFAVTRPIGNDNNESAISGGQYTAGFSGLAMANRAQDVVGSPAYYWDNTFPSQNITGAVLNPGALVGNTNPPMIHPSSGTPPMQFYWTTQVEHQFSPTIVASVGYVGMHTYHLGVWSKPNEVNPAMAQSKYGSIAAADGIPLNQFLALPINDARIQAAGILPPWPGFQAVFGPGATASQALRPWPQYGDVDNPLDPRASISYNGLQSSLQKHFSNGLTTLLSYTFSKTIGNADSNSGPSSGAENAIYAGSFYQDYYNPKSERSVTSSDIPHVVSLSYTYELPFGARKKFVNQGPLAQVVGGWSFSGMHHYQSGRPIHIEYDAFGASNPYFAAGDGFSFRPNLVPGQPFKNPEYKRSCSGPLFAATGRNPCQFYINPAAFSIPPSGEFGNAPNLISALRMPAYVNEDFSVSKRTKLYENLDLQFQANFFNAFNRTIFSSGGNAQTFIINAAPPDLNTSTLQNSNTVFGIMTAQQNGPRIIQFGMKLEF